MLREVAISCEKVAEVAFKHPQPHATYTQPPATSRNL
jgi:hypothetical protein